VDVLKFIPKSVSLTWASALAVKVSEEAANALVAETPSGIIVVINRITSKIAGITFTTFNETALLNPDPPVEVLRIGFHADRVLSLIVVICPPGLWLIEVDALHQHRPSFWPITQGPTYGSYTAAQDYRKKSVYVADNKTSTNKKGILLLPCEAKEYDRAYTRVICF